MCASPSGGECEYPADSSALNMPGTILEAAFMMVEMLLASDVCAS